MVKFVATHYADYFNGQFSLDDDTTTFLYNSTDSDTFTSGETITLQGGISGVTTFIGVTIIDGETFIVVQDGPFHYLFGQSAVNFPDLLDTLTINSDPFTFCFLAGTAIACPEGSRPIEDLAVGDLVLTADGSARRVRFVGRQIFATVFADPLRTRPIRISAGALGEGLPARDLCVSPDHALFVDGVLVQAGALVNGTTIARMTDLPECFTYYHVELEDHSLILAEGVPAETFVDNVTRQRFDNYEDYEALYGEAAATIAELDLPRIKSARLLPAAIRQQLQQRAALLETPPAAAVPASSAA